MISIQTMTDDAVLAEIGERLSAARLSRNQSQAELARAAGVSKRTVERMEAGESAQLTSVIRLLRALELLDGLGALLPPARPGPIELLRNQGKPPRRARRGTPPPRKPWTWAEDA
jgi:transcriptional regulator with XRE-family HTH domain